MIYLFIYLNFFLYVNSDLLKKYVKGVLRFQNGMIFCRVVPRTVVYLLVKFRDNPSFVWQSAAVLVLGFNRGHVSVLCFLGQKS